jgi:steroid delta-isomerase-like uncharacterized protein
MTCRAILFTALFMATLPCASAEAESSVAVDTVRAMVEAINNRDFDALDAVVAEDVQRHSAATPGVQVTSLEEFKQFLRSDLAAVPDAQQTIDVIFGTESMVAVRAIYSGTQTGPMGPFSPSGQKLELPFIGLLRVENGKIVEIWVEWDNLGALVQLGHIEPPGGPASEQ